MPKNLHGFPKQLPPPPAAALVSRAASLGLLWLLSHPLPGISWATPGRERCEIKSGTKDPFPATAEADGQCPADFSNTSVDKNRPVLSSLLWLQLTRTSLELQRVCTCTVRGNVQFLAIESLIKRPLFPSVIFGPSLPRVSLITFHAASNQFYTRKQCESWLPESWSGMELSTGNIAGKICWGFWGINKCFLIWTATLSGMYRQADVDWSWKPAGSTTV